VAKAILERGLLIAKTWNDLGASTLLFEAVLGEIRGPHPDTVTNRHLVDGKEEGLSVLLKAGNRDREAVLVAVGKPIDSGTGGIEGGSIAHRREMRHDLGSLLIGKLGF